MGGVLCVFAAMVCSSWSYLVAIMRREDKAHLFLWLLSGGLLLGCFGYAAIIGSWFYVLMGLGFALNQVVWAREYYYRVMWPEIGLAIRYLM